MSVLSFTDGEIIWMPLDLIHEIAAEAGQVLADFRLGADIIREAEQDDLVH